MHIKLHYVQHSVLLHITSIIQHMLVMICIYISVLYVLCIIIICTIIIILYYIIMMIYYMYYNMCLY